MTNSVVQFYDEDGTKLLSTESLCKIHVAEVRNLPGVWVYRLTGDPECSRCHA